MHSGRFEKGDRVVVRESHDFHPDYWGAPATVIDVQYNCQTFDIVEIVFDNAELGCRPVFSHELIPYENGIEKAQRIIKERG